VFAAPLQPRDLASRETGGEAFGQRKAQVRPVLLHAGKRAADERRLEATPHDLDFGQLGHIGIFRMIGRSCGSIARGHRLSYARPMSDASPSDTSTTFGFRSVDADERQGLVNRVFAAVADRYDLMNDLMSGGL